jgi:uncharacterized protein YunC (DUF1805 family)
MKAVIHTPYYDWDGRKYLELEIDNEIVRVKVPFRYGRVMCQVDGLRTVQELQKGDLVEVELVKKVWDGIEYWILASVKE